MSEFWVRKVRTWFSKLDTNSDGFMSEEDFEEMVDKLAVQENLRPEQKAKTKHLFVELWRAFMKPTGSDDNGLLTPSILVATLETQRNDPKFKEAWVKACHDLFGIRDVNGDGYLSEDDYKRAFVGIGVQDASFVHAGFEYMDVNKDGKLSINEYTAGLLAYLTTEDEHLLYGPLVSEIGHFCI